MWATLGIWKHHIPAPEAVRGLLKTYYLPLLERSIHGCLFGITRIMS